MAALFKQEFGAPSPGATRGRPGSTKGQGPRAGEGGGAGEGGASGGRASEGAATGAPERVRQLKEAFAKVLAATGEQLCLACSRPGVAGLACQAAAGLHMLLSHLPLPTCPPAAERPHATARTLTHPPSHPPTLPPPPAGAADVEALQEALGAGEAASFRLFSYVNDLSAEVDRLEEGAAALR